MTLISGKEIAEEIQKELKKKIKSFGSPRKPGLAMVLVGEHLPSHTYVNVKKRACEDVGIHSRVVNLAGDTSLDNILHTIYTLNKDPAIDGILLQSPLPAPLDAQKAYQAIDPNKDVDGFHPLNMGKLLLGLHDGFTPCTPLGVMEMLKRSSIEVTGKHAVVVGRSNIVGKPLAALLLQANATVTIAHSKTQNLPEITRSADILVAAIGSAGFIKEEMVKKGAIVIDVGINRQNDHSQKGYRIVGDVDFEGVQKLAAAITPVPKGVGPMTVAMLLHNTILSFERRCAPS